MARRRPAVATWSPRSGSDRDLSQPGSRPCRPVLLGQLSRVTPPEQDTDPQAVLGPRCRISGGTATPAGSGPTTALTSSDSHRETQDLASGFLVHTALPSTVRGARSPSTRSDSIATAAPEVTATRSPWRRSSSAARLSAVSRRVPITSGGDASWSGMVRTSAQKSRVPGGSAAPSGMAMGASETARTSRLNPVSTTTKLKIVFALRYLDRRVVPSVDERLDLRTDSVGSD